MNQLKRANPEPIIVHAVEHYEELFELLIKNTRKDFRNQTSWETLQN